MVKLDSAPPHNLYQILLLPRDELCYRPYQIWEVEVYSLKRVDMSAVVGSQSKFPVILRGTDTTRCVTCFSSTPKKLQVGEVLEECYLI